ncbi:hypothetical protein F8M41_010531 [Gigaspora margarita]|uniref:Uncharacterized protein n=1 Tax=Gigaspora margarita TaxID=4874 RepID=A0A8H4EQ38_GIGMA|nr:hypothetical protein F8M41_010531 [Gigaspora margarita]
MGVEKINKFVDYFGRWWRLKYEMWMICTRGIFRDTMDTNNLIELFHRKLKYIYTSGWSEELSAIVTECKDKEERIIIIFRIALQQAAQAESGKN